jgi:hypothetical protein
LFSKEGEGSSKSVGTVQGGDVEPSHSGTMQVGTNAPNNIPIRTVENSLEKVAGIRGNLDIGQKRNIAFAEFSIDGKAGELIGVSGKANRPGTVGIPENPRFETITTGNNPRTLDSEVKILENLSAQLSPGAKGTINLFS